MSEQVCKCSHVIYLHWPSKEAVGHCGVPGCKCKAYEPAPEVSNDHEVQPHQFVESDLVNWCGFGRKVNDDGRIDESDACCEPRLNPIHTQSEPHPAQSLIYSVTGGQFVGITPEPHPAAAIAPSGHSIWCSKGCGPVEECSVCGPNQPVSAEPGKQEKRPERDLRLEIAAEHLNEQLYGNEGLDIIRTDIIESALTRYADTLRAANARLEKELAEAKAAHGKTLLLLNTAAFETMPALVAKNEALIGALEMAERRLAEIYPPDISADDDAECRAVYNTLAHIRAALSNAAKLEGK